MYWFVGANGWLEGGAPLDHMDEEPAAVLEAASHYNDLDERLMASQGLSELLQVSGGNGRTNPVEFTRLVRPGEERLVSLLGGSDSKLHPSLSAKAQTFVDDSISLLGEAIKLNPDEATVIRWFNEGRLSFLSHMTPAEALALGHLEALLAYVESLDAGWSG